MDPPNSEGYLAFEVLRKDPNAAAAFAALVRNASLPGKFYGLSGLKITNPDAFKKELPAFLDSDSDVNTVNGCVVGDVYKCSYVAEVLRDTDYPECVYRLELDFEKYTPRKK